LIIYCAEKITEPLKQRPNQWGYKLGALITAIWGFNGCEVEC